MVGLTHSDNKNTTHMRIRFLRLIFLMLSIAVPLAVLIGIGLGRRFNTFSLIFVATNLVVDLTMLRLLYSKYAERVLPFAGLIAGALTTMNILYVASQPTYIAFGLVLSVFSISLVNGVRTGMLSTGAGVLLVAMLSIVYGADWFERNNTAPVWIPVSIMVVVLLSGALIALVMRWIEQTTGDLQKQLKHTTEELDTMRHHTAMLSLLAHLPQRLLQTFSWRSSIRPVLTDVGQLLDADYVSLYLIGADEARHTIARRFGDSITLSLHEHIEPGLPCKLEVHQPVFSGWVNEMHNGNAVSGNTSDFTAAEGAFLNEYRIKSLLLLPVHVHGNWWGMILCAAITQSRNWSKADTDLVSTVADTLGLVVEREAIEERTAVQAATNRAILQAIPDTLIRVDADNNIVDIMATPERYQDYGATHFVGRKITDIASEDRAGELLTHLESVRNIASPQDLTFRVTIPGKGLRYMDIRSSLSHADEVLTVMRDVTTEHQSAVLFETLFQKSPDIIVLINASTELIVDVNPALEKILSIEPASVKGMHHQTLFQNRIIDADTIYNNAEFHARGLRDQIEMNDNAGISHTMEITVAGLRIDGTRYIMMILRDISKDEQEDSDNEEVGKLMSNLKRERELSMMQMNFINTVSHQFRTPLTIIQLSLEIMEKHWDKLSEDRRRRRYKLMHEQIDRMEMLTQSVLNYDSVSSARSAFEPLPIDIESYIREQAVHIASQFPEEVLITVSVDSELNMIEADALLFKQILEHLLSNAAKFTRAVQQISQNQETDHDRNVYVVASKEGDMLRVVITDNGIGIPEDQLKDVFEPFFRAENAATIEGTGLGLTIVRRAVHRHKGEVWLERRDNGSIRANLRLPLRQPDYNQPTLRAVDDFATG